MTMRVAKFAGLVLVLALFLGPIGRWPWDHDEVHSLVELGHEPMDRFPGPGVQVEKMHRIHPVWAAVQNAALLVLPDNEWGTRVMPAACGVLVVLMAFGAAGRARGTWFAWSLGLLLATSQTLIWLSQQNRFYSLALLWLTLNLCAIFREDRRARYDVMAVLCGICAVLSHNLTLVMVVLVALSTAATWVIGSTSWLTVRRSAATAVAVIGVYLFYLRPILRGWVSGGTGGTSPIISFVAQAGIVPVGLALYGSVVAFTDRKLHAWLLLLVAGLSFVALSPMIMGNWNPRYGLFFMVPLLFLAAAGAAAVAEALPSTTFRLAWLATVLMLAMPKFASHFIDGSRHDFRSAAQVVASRGAGDRVLSNWPATLQYYLEPQTGAKPGYWAQGDRLPTEETVVVLASNAWEPVLQIQGRRVDVLAEIGKRRFDEQSHLIRVYRVHAD